MSEWTDSADSMCEKENDAADFQPSKKRLKKLPSPKGKQHVCEIVSSEDQESISKDLYLQIWAPLTFKPWITSQNERSADKPTDIDILSKPVDLECTQLCLALCLFVVEVRKGNGEPYPSRTVYHLLAGLLRFAPSESTCPYFLDPKHVWYKKLQGTMDTHFRRLRRLV